MLISARKASNDKIINEIKQCLVEMDQNQLEIILNAIQNQSLNSTIGTISKLRLSSDEISDRWIKRNAKN